MSLPGLNLDASKYPVTIRGDKHFAEIPFADWLPPDHKNVWCFDFHGKSDVAYYSPLANLMVSALDHTSAKYSTHYEYWLKELK